MTEEFDFDGDDLVAAIFGSASGSPAKAVAPMEPARHAMGWVLLASLLLAVGAAVGLAYQSTTASVTPRTTPECGGLYSNCCDDWDDNWGPCPDGQPAPTRCDQAIRRGLFDAEDEFTDC